MSEVKLELIKNAADEYKKLSNTKQMFVLGFMQGVLFNQADQQGRDHKAMGRLEQDCKASLVQEKGAGK